MRDNAPGTPPRAAQHVLDVDRPPVAGRARPLTKPGVSGKVSPIDEWATQRPMPRPPGAGTLPRPGRCVASVDAAHPGGVLGHGVQDRLEVGRRARDHAQDLGGRRLLLEGLVSSRFRASSSLNRRTFSMAMTAWLANVSRSAICLAEKGLGLGPPIDEDDALAAYPRAAAASPPWSGCRTHAPQRRTPLPGTPARRPGCPRRRSSARSRTTRPATVSRLTGDGFTDRHSIAGSGSHAAPPRGWSSPSRRKNRRIHRPADPGGVLDDGFA